MSLTRVDLINLLLQRTVGDQYLEIGVRRGETLSQVQSSNKTGVDPNPSFDKLAPELHPLLAQASFFTLDSDSFFAKNISTFDVIFIDGLHQYEQVLKDVANALKVLKNGGFIVLHDCCPIDAYSATREWHEGVWYGDVWKTIYHISRDYPQINYIVIADDCGMGILWKNTTIPAITPDQNIISLPFEYYAANKNNFLHLTPTDCLSSVLPKTQKNSGLWQKIKNIFK